MKNYKIIYSFEALDEIAKGKRVYVLDRLLYNVEYVNDIAIGRFAAIAKQSAQEKNRFEFWIEEETEEIKE